MTEKRDAEQKSVPSFTTFLEIVQGRSRPPGSAEAAESATAMLRILVALDDSGDADLDHLWRATGLDLADFAKALKAAQSSDLVASRNTDAGDVFTLTDTGKAIADSVRP